MPAYRRSTALSSSSTTTITLRRTSVRSTPETRPSFASKL